MVAIAVVLALLGAFWLYKRRQRKLRDAARKEEDHFVDLDGDEDVVEDGNGGLMRGNRRHAAARQSYNISPFPYSAVATAAGAGTSNLSQEPIQPAASPSQPFSNSAASNRSNSIQTHPRSADWHSQSTQYAPHAALPAGAGIPVPSSPPPSSVRLAGPSNTAGAPFQGAALSSHSRTNSQGSFGMRGPMRVLNADGDGAAGGQQAGPLPQKTPLLPGDERDEHLARSDSTPRLIQHADAGPIPAPVPAAAEEAVEELPPQYGGWAARQASLKRT